MEWKKEVESLWLEFVLFAERNAEEMKDEKFCAKFDFFVGTFFCRL